MTNNQFIDYFSLCAVVTAILILFDGVSEPYLKVLLVRALDFSAVLDKSNG